ncbi:2-hydroxychromene-2-carboxylate isomerase [Paraperlucidibaca baekdonensis]|uniref:2-hydroxychromene-2-carboxylate isomerase n=1 Tax=Paraperlucidibaca baekdonensis TaxID=748120 RepID=A0A3E0H9V9_9GAMM|nr:DsbA family protein [Paraperlucidibaca baekdonensis]REH40413.1 2-hydroxychromene-2-carboxylate isomerase [Paraperlucidibaca baekdonensis]
MSRLQRLLQPRLSAALTSTRLRDLRRTGLEAWRRLGRYPHQLTVWLRVDDPYAYLLLQALPTLEADFGVRIGLRVLGDGGADTTPEPERLQQFACDDATRLARWHGLDAPPQWQASAQAIAQAQRQLLDLAATETSVMEPARDILRALWQPTDAAPSPNAIVPSLDAHAAQLKANNDAQRQLGHYASAMLHYAGEWYWGLDRLDHLTRRLSNLQLGTSSAQWSTHLDGHFLVGEPERLADLRALDTTLDVYFSYRSPYSYLALARVRALAEHYGLALRFKPVLPMVMRGLPVPTIKRLYILLDSKREADVLELPFGRICDPVGLGVEHCLAVTQTLASPAQAMDFAESACAAIWHEGRDLSQLPEIYACALRAGITADVVDAALANAHWRAAIEANREDLFAQNLWGVPSFVLHLNGQRLCHTWGQDRLWVLEDALNDALATTGV